jgi:hypothetical protein
MQNLRIAFESPPSPRPELGNLPPLHQIISKIKISSTPLLERYDPARFPLFPEMEHLSFPLKVGIVTGHKLMGEAKHYFYDGILSSEYLELAGIVLVKKRNKTEPNLVPSDADVWLVDGGRLYNLQPSVRPAFLENLFLPNRTTTTASTTTPSWKILLVDFGDHFQARKYSHFFDCWNQANVRVAVRSVVRGRNYNPSNGLIQKGHIDPNLTSAGGPVLHCPFAVRSDIVHAVQQAVVEVENNSTLALEQHVIMYNRPIDVLHLWKLLKDSGNAELRNNVTLMVDAWNGTSCSNDNRTMNTVTTEKGNRSHRGRNSVHQDYVQAMISAKIVIVTQRDLWEDHYRLMEALVCGALVIADTMLAPPKGLVHGETIVFFETLQELEEAVMYYLIHEEERRAIAQRGWRLAMGRHRSWHRIEELFFGTPLTRAL